ALPSERAVAKTGPLSARGERVPGPEAAVARILDPTGRGGRAEERIDRLSGGNRQRVNVAIALISGPAVLALDEPTSSLDPGQRERLWEFVGGLAGAGACVVFSTHTVQEAHRHADRVIVLDRGELLFRGPPLELMQDVGQEGADFEHALVIFLAERAAR